MYSSSTSSITTILWLRKSLLISSSSPLTFSCSMEILSLKWTHSSMSSWSLRSPYCIVSLSSSSSINLPYDFSRPSTHTLFHHQCGLSVPTLTQEPHSVVASYPSNNISCLKYFENLFLPSCFIQIGPSSLLFPCLTMSHYDHSSFFNFNLKSTHLALNQALIPPVMPLSW